MKKIQSSITNMVIVLTLISIVAGGVLAWVHASTEAQIQKINEDNLAQGICKVMNSNDIQVTDTKEADGYTFYSVSSGNTPIGVTVLSTVLGFGGDVKVLVGFDQQGTILGYTILAHNETPGLGAKAGKWFQQSEKGDIIGKNPSICNLTVSKDGGDIDAITAATITSRAFLNAVTNAYKAAFPSAQKSTANK